MVFIETPASRAAWKTAAGAAETRAGSIAHTVHPILAIRSARKRRSHRSARLRIGRGPQLRRGPRGHPETGSYSSSLSCIPVQYPREDAISSRFQDSALKCGMRPRIYRSPTRCFGACGTAARRLPGTPVGDTPNCARFQGCEPEKVGSGRRDLVKPLCHLLGFRVSGYPTSSSWQTHLVLAADW